MKRILEFSIKFLLVFASIYFIIDQIEAKKVMDIPINGQNYIFFILIGLLFILVWFLEIFKWKLAVLNFKKISWQESTKQTLLANLTTPYIPAKMGEYGVKLLYFSKDEKDKVLIAHFLIHFFQMSASIFFGIIGLLFVPIKENKILNFVYLFFGLVGILLLIMVIFKKISFFGVTFEKIYLKITSFSKTINLKIAFLSVLKYMVILHQFYFFLLFFDVEITYFQVVTITSSMYLITSVVPSISLFDVALKGSVSIYLFSFLGIESEKILWISASVWIFNIALPLVIALVYFIINKGKFI